MDLLKSEWVPILSEWVPIFYGDLSTAQGSPEPSFLWGSILGAIPDSDWVLNRIDSCNFELCLKGLNTM